MMVTASTLVGVLDESTSISTTAPPGTTLSQDTGSDYRMLDTKQARLEHQGIEDGRSIVYAEYQQYVQE